VSQQSTNRAFDDLARTLAEGSISRRRALKLFAGTAIAALIPSRALAQPNKVTICHKPGTPDQKTLRVPESARGAHLGHGDSEGPCGTTTTTSTSTSTSSTTSTSTSTTSTSTTPMCQPNGGTCSADTDCCGGNCCGPSTGSPGRCFQHNSTPCTSDAQCCGSCQSTSLGSICFDR
jgi:hypothetical protein